MTRRKGILKMTTPLRSVASRPVRKALEAHHRKMRELDTVNVDKKTYDLELRPRLMVKAIEQLQDAGVEADVWKVEGLDRREDCEKIVPRLPPL
jgi:myo-inositol catabolism protein IolC